MRIALYNSNAEKNRLNKSAFLKPIITMNGTLRSACSITTPVINIELNPELVKMNIENKIFLVDDSKQYLTTNGSIKLIYEFISTILTANYAYIPDFNRYYFITDITSIRNNLWQISMRVDVLMSYFGYIKDLDAFITRNEFMFDPMIKDALISYYYDKDVIEYIPSKGTKVNYTFKSLTGITDNNFTITVVNNASMSFDEIDPPSAILPKVGGWVAGANGMTNTYAAYPASITNLGKRLLQDDNLATFVLSIMCYPFVIPSSGDDPLVLGSKELTPSSEGATDGVYVSLLNKKCSDYMVIADFTINGDTFLDYNPYTTYDVFMPYLGWISLDPDLILNKRLLVIYNVDYKSGSAQVSIVDDTSNKIIYTAQTQLGIKIPVTTTNATEVDANRINNNIGLGLGLTASAISVVGGVASGNPLVVGAGVLSATRSITSFIQNNNTNYSRASGSVGSGNSGVYLPQDVLIRKTSLKPRNYDSNYARLFGKPLNAYMKIGDLKGYTQIGDVHIEKISTATDNEITEIDSILRSGIII